MTLLMVGIRIVLTEYRGKKIGLHNGLSALSTFSLKFI